MSDAELLTQVEAVIQRRMSGQAYDEWSEGDVRFKGTALTELFKIRTQLQQNVAAAAGGQLTLARIRRD